jgi:hypothetical protein
MEAGLINSAKSRTKMMGDFKHVLLVFQQGSGTTLIKSGVATYSLSNLGV